MIPTRDVMVPLYQEGLEALMPMTISVLCATCLHWRENLQCDAFPEGIPRPIWTGASDHRRPFPGDHGIVYALAERVLAPPELPPLQGPLAEVIP
jgi:hypothetical protein